jgi:hypothetical protein
MHALIVKNASFSDEVLRAMEEIETGVRRAASFSWIDTAGALRQQCMVFAEWVGEVYSWRVATLEKGEVVEPHGEVLAGEGEEGEAATVAARLAWAMAQKCADGGIWKLMD